MAEDKIKKQDEMSLEKIENIKLDDIKEFFYCGIYENITEKYDIHTLYDLIKKSANGELFKIIFSLPISNEEKNEQYKEIIGCVSLLMCKYFNQDPMLRKDDNIKDIKYKIMLDDYWISELEGLGITKLGQLLVMAEKNDYSVLYSKDGLGRFVEPFFVEQINLIYNYLMSKDKSQNDENINNQKIEVTHDINNQYDELQRLIVESNQISEKIAEVKSKIVENEIGKKQGDNFVNSDYSEINNISIIEVKTFFSTRNFEFLVNHGILTLADLLNVNFQKLLMNFMDRPYNERLKIVATIRILRCKYLGEDPKIDNQISYKDFEFKLGISSKIQIFLHNELGVNNLEDLMQMIENKDFSHLNKIKSEELIAKLIVLYNFNKLNHQHTNKNNRNNYGSTDYLDFYKLLKELVLQNDLLIECINETQSKLNKSLRKVKCL